MLVKRSQALIDYHIMLFAPHFIHHTKHARERKRETERQRDRETERNRESRYDYEIIFLWKKNKIPLVNIKLFVVQYQKFRLSVSDENLTKWALLVQRSQALIDYHTMFFAPHFIHQTKHARERKTQRDRETERDRGRDRERQKESRYNYESIFSWKKNKIPLVNIKLFVVQYLYFYYYSESCGSLQSFFSV